MERSVENVCVWTPKDTVNGAVPVESFTELGIRRGPLKYSITLCPHMGRGRGEPDSHEILRGFHRLLRTRPRGLFSRDTPL